LASSALAVLPILRGVSPASTSASFRRAMNQAAANPLGTGDWLVVAGKRVGAISLGDAEESVMKLQSPPLARIRRQDIQDSYVGPSTRLHCFKTQSVQVFSMFLPRAARWWR